MSHISLKTQLSRGLLFDSSSDTHFEEVKEIRKSLFWFSGLKRYVGLIDFWVILDRQTKMLLNAIFIIFFLKCAAKFEEERLELSIKFQIMRLKGEGVILGRVDGGGYYL